MHMLYVYIRLCMSVCWDMLCIYYASCEFNGWTFMCTGWGHQISCSAQVAARLACLPRRTRNSSISAIPPSHKAFGFACNFFPSKQTSKIMKIKPIWSFRCFGGFGHWVSPCVLPIARKLPCYGFRSSKLSGALTAVVGDLAALLGCLGKRMNHQGGFRIQRWEDDNFLAVSVYRWQGI